MKETDIIFDKEMYALGILKREKTIHHRRKL